LLLPAAPDRILPDRDTIRSDSIYPGSPLVSIGSCPGTSRPRPLRA